MIGQVISKKKPFVKEALYGKFYRLIYEVNSAFKIESNAFAACSCVPVVRCPYKSLVTLMLECAKRRERLNKSELFRIAKVACECLVL